MPRQYYIYDRAQYKGVGPPTVFAEAGRATRLSYVYGDGAGGDRLWPIRPDPWGTSENLY